jgi:hypothetical protein
LLVPSNYELLACLLLFDVNALVPEVCKDIVLEPGSAYKLSKNGTSLVLALRSARIAIEAPAVVYTQSALSRVLARAKALWTRRISVLTANGSLISSARTPT